MFFFFIASGYIKSLGEELALLKTTATNRTSFFKSVCGSNTNTLSAILTPENFYNFTKHQMGVTPPIESKMMNVCSIGVKLG